jgi:hypothetical protein
MFGAQSKLQFKTMESRSRKFSLDNNKSKKNKNTKMKSNIVIQQKDLNMHDIDKYCISYISFAKENTKQA